MDDEHMALGANFDRFIDVLDNLDGGLPDLHIGVVSSDMGSLGVLPASTGCDGLGDNGALHVGTAPILTGERFLVDVADTTPGARVTNYSGDLRSAFASLASVGIEGCGFEQHLEAMHAALENPVNVGFLRPNASLAVIFVADEDDCSARVPELFGNSPSLGLLDSFRCFEFGVVCDQADLRAPGVKTGCRAATPSPYLYDVQRYIDQLRDLRPIADVVVAAIVGDREPVIVGTQMPQSGGTHPTVNASCTYGPPGPDEQSADPAIRLGEFVDSFGQRGQVETICQDDLSEPLRAIGQMIVDNQGDPCLKGALADTDPSTPELDPECSVSIYVPDAADPDEQVLPACDAGATVQPCWRLIPDPDQCSSHPTGLAIDIVRTVALPPGTRIAASCVVE
jgi:hypothetical protein